jgi:hypothetical protein
MKNRILKTWRVRFHTNSHDRWPFVHEMHVEAYDRAHALMLAAMATTHELWAKHVTRTSVSLSRVQIKKNASR